MGVTETNPIPANSLLYVLVTACCFNRNLGPLKDSWCHGKEHHNLFWNLFWGSWFGTPVEGQITKSHSALCLKIPW